MVGGKLGRANDTEHMKRNMSIDARSIIACLKFG